MASPQTPEQRLLAIISKTNELKLYIDKFYDYYGIRGSKASDMLDGVLKVLSNEDNPERLFQAAHSLREILYSLITKHDNKFRYKRKRTGARHQKVQNDVAKKFSRFNINMHREENSAYSKLTNVAHHSPWIANNKDENLWKFIMIMEEFVDLMLKITKPGLAKSYTYKINQFNSTRLIGSIMGKPPP